MAEKSFGLQQMDALLVDEFASWVQQLNIEPKEVTENGALFQVPENGDLTRGGGILCGQAISAIADTVGVLALCAHNDPFRMMTTVDMTTHFMRPLMEGIVDAEVTILSNGRRMATVRVDFSQNGSPKICAGATCAFAYIDQ